MHERDPGSEDLERAIRDGVRDTDAETAAAGHVEPADLPAITEWFNEPEPPAAIWRDNPNQPDGEPAGARGRDAVASDGEPALLSAPGKSGKSFVALDLALAAAVADVTGADFGAACGLRVRAGGTVIRSYEDRAVRLAARLRGCMRRWEQRRLATGEALNKAAGRIRIAVDPEALFVPGESRTESVRTGATWAPFWAGVEGAAPALVILDPASALIHGASMNDSGLARYAMGKIAAESERLNVGVLIVSHDTKEARRAAAGGGKPGAGAVAGSATWFDAARGILYLYRDPHTEGGRMLQCLAVNHGRDEWGADLAGVTNVPGVDFAGYELRGNLDRDQAEAKRQAWEAAERTAEAKRDPKTDWCSATAKTGKRCQRDAVKDGLCSQHWREKAPPKPTGSPSP